MVHDINGLSPDQELEVGMNCRFRKEGVVGEVVSIIQPEGMRIARIRITSDAHKNEMREVYTISGLPRLCDAPGNQFDVVSILTANGEEVMEEVVKEQSDTLPVYFNTRAISDLIKQNSKLNWDSAHFQEIAKILPTAQGKTKTGRRTNLYTREQAEAIFMRALDNAPLVKILIEHCPVWTGPVMDTLSENRAEKKPEIVITGNSPVEELPSSQPKEALWSTGASAKPIMGSKYFPNEDEEAPTFTEEEIGETPAQPDLLSELEQQKEKEDFYAGEQWTEGQKEEIKAHSAADIGSQVTEPQRKVKKKLKEIEAEIVSETSEKHKVTAKLSADEYAAHFKQAKISELVIQRELLEIYLDVDDLEMECTMELSGDDSEVPGKLYSLKERIKQLYQLIRFPDKG